MSILRYYARLGDNLYHGSGVRKMLELRWLRAYVDIPLPTGSAFERIVAMFKATRRPTDWLNVYREPRHTHRSRSLYMVETVRWGVRPKFKRTKKYLAKRKQKVGDAFQVKFVKYEAAPRPAPATRPKVRIVREVQ